MDVKKSNKEIPIHSNSFTQNNHPSPPALSSEGRNLPPTVDPYKDPNQNPTLIEEMIRYRECQRNHAAHLGSHVVDGCGEFMPSGEGDTPLAFKCAACDCHRNFHRREMEGETTTNTAAAATTNIITAAAPAVAVPLPAPSTMTAANCYISFSKYHKNNNLTNAAPVYHQQQQGKHPHHRASVMMAFGNGGVAADSSSDEFNAYRAGELNYGGQFGKQFGVSKKRFRTKFSQEQKDKMMEFAAKIGWKIQKQDDVEVQRFCQDVGVKRQVFKVWMHNNKQAINKKQA